MSEVSYPVGHLLANLLLHILTLGCACATSGHSLLAGNQTMNILDVSLVIWVWIVFRIHPYMSTANVIREVFKKSKWKFKMAFAIRGPTP